ncbi:hypothetical protein HJC22_19120 [Corallococcus exiguus]|uniref:hypothetical protein n=1 Tax=Corallococcus exiguus TaxID=83462 RepID=UPI0014716BCB|nr:hypothetical protein [Corallococcus exiguus]NNC17829.1 hypothetical protein [Corallococcus exiguus]
MSPRRDPPSSASTKLADPKRFDPADYTVVTVHKEAKGLVLGGDPEDFIRYFKASLHPYDPDAEEEPEQREVVATVRFSHVAFGAWGGNGRSIKFDFADAVSGELLEIADALFDDEHGDTREELDVSGAGADLLHIEMIEVTPGYETFEVVRYLLAHILERYGHGCMGAVYYQADWESIGVARPLKERCFRQLRTKNRQVWFVDLGRVQPPLDEKATESPTSEE